MTVPNIFDTNVPRKVQYRQIDFLRLFRLGKGLGYFKRKRNMPISYDSNDALKCCKRLFRDFLVKTFPKDENFTIAANESSFMIHFSGEYYYMFNYFISNKEFIASLDGGKDALAKAEDLLNSGDDFIRISVTKLYVQPYVGNSRGYYNDHSSPREKYYLCAKRVIEYRDQWNKNFPVIWKFYLKRTKLEQKMLKEKEEKEEKKNKELQEEMKKKEIKRKAKGQAAFDAVLENFRRTTTGEG